MKVYGTLTSERASKGQGGKELHVEIRGESKSVIAEFWIKPVSEYKYKMDLWTQKEQFSLDLMDVEGEDKLKGKKQKGVCGVCNVKVADNVEIHNHYIRT